MERALLKRSIDDWRTYYLRKRTTDIKRAFDITIPPIAFGLALIGLRRSGKTSTAIQISCNFKSEEVLYYNFEDPLFYQNSSVHDLELILDVAQEYASTPLKLLILDEIHNVRGWEKWVRKLIDLQRQHVIVTGSSAKLLSSEISTSLSGRCLEQEIWPLSIAERTGFADQPGDALQQTVRDILSWGGLPEVVLQRDPFLKEKILRQYLSDCLYKDVINRFEIRNVAKLNLLLTYYLSNISSLHSYSAIKKAFEIPTDTSALYTNALSSAYLIFEVSRYHNNLKVQNRDPKKVYAGDLGLRRVAAIAKQEDTGKLLENEVFIELRRRSKQLYYYREEQEVDFIITEHYRPTEAIQVCADMRNADTRRREIEALKLCCTQLKLATGTVVTLDWEEEIKIQDLQIHCIPAARWLNK